MHTISPPKPRTTDIQTAVRPIIIALSAGDAAALYKEAQTNLFIRDDQPLPTALPQEIFQTTLIRTCEKYDRGTDWAMNALLHTVQKILYITASRFPDEEPSAQIIEETLSNSERFSPCPYTKRMANSCMDIYRILQEYGLSKEDIMSSNTVLEVRPRDILETIQRFRNGETYVEAAWNAYVFERDTDQAFKLG